MVSSKGNCGMGNGLHCHYLTISPHSTRLQTFRTVPSFLNPYNATSLLDTLHMIPATYLILFSQPTNLSSNFSITFMPKPQSFNNTDLKLESFSSFTVENSYLSAVLLSLSPSPFPPYYGYPCSYCSLQPRFTIWNIPKMAKLFHFC